MSLSGRPGIMPRRKSSAANLMSKFQSDAPINLSLPPGGSTGHSRASTSIPFDSDDAQSFVSSAYPTGSGFAGSSGSSVPHPSDAGGADSVGATTGQDKDDKKGPWSPSVADKMLRIRMQYFAQLKAGHSGLFWLETVQIPTADLVDKLDPVKMRQRAIQYTYLSHSISEILDQSQGSTAYNILKLLKQMLDEHDQWLEQTINSSGKMTNVFKNRQGSKVTKRPSLPTASGSGGSTETTSGMENDFVGRRPLMQTPAPRFLTPNYPTDLDYPQAVTSLATALIETYLKLQSLLFPLHQPPSSEPYLSFLGPPTPLSSHLTQRGSYPADIDNAGQEYFPGEAGSADDPYSYATFLKQSSNQSTSQRQPVPPGTPSTVVGHYPTEGMDSSALVDEWGSSPTPSSISSFAHESLHPTYQPTLLSGSSTDHDSSPSYRSVSSSSGPTPTTPTAPTGSYHPISRAASFSASSTGSGNAGYSSSTIWPPYPAEAGGKEDGVGGRRSLSNTGGDGMMGPSGAGGAGSSGLSKRKSEKERWVDLGDFLGKVDERIKKCLNPPKNDLTQVALHLSRLHFTTLIDLCSLPLSPPSSPPPLLPHTSSLSPTSKTFPLSHSNHAIEALQWPDPEDPFEEPEEVFWSWGTHAINREEMRARGETVVTPGIGGSSGQGGGGGEEENPMGEMMRSIGGRSGGDHGLIGGTEVEGSFEHSTFA